MRSLIDAVIEVESNGVDTAIGDRKLPNRAYGPMQIRQPVLDDIKRVYGVDFMAPQMLGERYLSIAVFCLYMEIYATVAHLGHAPTNEDRARIWNGGPNGWRLPATEGYWAKVEAAMNMA